MSDSPELDAVLLLTRANAAASEALGTALNRVGLSLYDLSLLLLVADAGQSGLDRAGLASGIRLPQSEALRLAKQMEKVGWLERSEAGAFSLSLNGEALVVEASGLAANRSESWLADRLGADRLSDEDVQSLLRILGSLAE